MTAHACGAVGDMTKSQWLKADYKPDSPTHPPMHVVLPGEKQSVKLLDYLPEHIYSCLLEHIVSTQPMLHNQIHSRFLRFAYSVIASENRIA